VERYPGSSNVSGEELAWASSTEASATLKSLYSARSKAALQRRILSDIERFEHISDTVTDAGHDARGAVLPGFSLAGSALTCHASSPAASDVLLVDLEAPLRQPA
jgi:hypothetical protein